MRTRILRPFALVTMLFLVILIATNAGAVAAQGASQSGKYQFTGKARALKPIGNVKFAATAKAPSQPKTVDEPKDKLNVNRALPSRSKNVPGSQTSAIPTVGFTSIVKNATPGGLTAKKGLNAFDSWQAEGNIFQPPDQGLCAGNGYVLEMVNDVVAIYDGNLSKISGNMLLGNFFLLSPDRGAGGDPKCYYDPRTKRFFATQFVTGGPEDPVDTSLFVYIAVSATEDPRLGWYIYALDVTFDCPDGMAPCFGDQPLLGANSDALFISTNVFQWEGNGFFGSALYAIDKRQLVVGSLGQLVNVAYMPVGTDVPTPDGACDQINFYCWYSVQPAFAARAGDWDKGRGGTEYFMSTLEFHGGGDHRIALWAITNTQSLHAAPGSFSLTVNVKTLTSLPYINPQDFSAQKDDGLIPYGKVYYNAPAAGPIQPNDDRMNQVFLVNGTLWSGINTGLMQRVTSHKTAYHNGILYFGLMPKWKNDNLGGEWVQSSYIAPEHADALFPSIVVGSNNQGAMVYSVTGWGRYPSGAYTLLDAAGDPNANRTYISHPGQSSYDGSCEYNPACGGGVLRPRWGDYSAAVMMDGQAFLATEYIQTHDCDVTEYLLESNNGGYPTCGDTRAYRQNWGTALSKLTAP